MAQYVEAFGSTLEFPDGMSQDEMAAAIKRHALKISASKIPPINANPSEGGGSLKIGPLDTGIKTPEWLDRGLSGIGKSMYDTATGLGQFITATDRADVAESRRLNKPLMDTTAGKVGDVVGNLATTLPLAFIPGANTVKGASLIGAATGLAQPSESGTETLMNTGMGALAGGGSILAGRGLAAGYQGITGLLRPMTQKGQEQIAAEILQASATDPAKAIANARQAREFVPGSRPTMGQASGDEGLAQLERTLYNAPETQGPLARQYASQMEARKKAIASVAGTPEYRSAIEDGRKVFANQDYQDAFAQGIDQEAAKMLQPQIESLMRRPSIQSAKMIAKSLAAENDKTLTDFGSVEGLHWLKTALDNQISAAQGNGASIGKAKLAALVQTKNDLMQTLEQIAPGYKLANDNFAGMSRNINSMDVAADLQKKLYKNAEWGAGKEMSSTYQSALSDALESVKKQTGMDRKLSDVMNTNDIAALEGVAYDLARKEKGQTLGRAVGSPTMQNMMGQNLINRIAGPLGAPQSFSESVIANTIARPYEFAMQAGKPKIQGLLAEAMADPVKAQQLLSYVRKETAAGRMAKETEKFLSVPGLLALEDR